MKLLVIGSGGREHALAWHLAKASGLQKIYVAPGNAGTANEPEIENLPLTDPVELAEFAQRQGVHLTLVGPEAPLAEGIVDLFRDRGLKIFGPNKKAAQLESSKDFAKRFMLRHKIPTAAFASFDDAAAAHAHIEQQGAPIVIKADGLAAGKGVTVARTPAEAHQAIDALFATPGARVVIEECLEGEEASFIAMVDGKNILPLATCQDHKRLNDGDTGPNTGGMGACSPAPVVTPAIHAKIMREIITPAVRGMAAEGTPFTGFLYAGLMVGQDGSVKALEFNCRMGDPEAQVILMRLKSDLLQLLEHGVAGKLDEIEADWDRRVALCVVLAAAAYPATPQTGDVISGLPENGEEVHVFHSGTAQQGNEIVTSGGRVLGVTVLGDNVKQARKHAYDALAGIHFAGMQYRNDIGAR